MLLTLFAEMQLPAGHSFEKHTDEGLPQESMCTLTAVIAWIQGRGLCHLTKCCSTMGRKRVREVACMAKALHASCHTACRSR